MPDDKIVIYNDKLYTKNGLVVDYNAILLHDNQIITKTTQIPSSLSSYTIRLPQSLNTYQRWILRLYMAPIVGQSMANINININEGAVKTSAQSQLSYSGMTTWLTVFRFDNLLYYLVYSNYQVFGSVSPLYNHTYISISCDYSAAYVGTFEATFGIF